MQKWIPQRTASLRVVPCDDKRLSGMLGAEQKLPQLEALARAVRLDDLSAEIERILQSEQTGRVVVRLHESEAA